MFVAGFIGSPAMNLMAVDVANGSVSLGGVAIPASATGLRSLIVGVRPESLELATEGIPARVDVVEEIGADAYIFCSAEIGGVETKLVARAGAKNAPDREARVFLRPLAAEAHLFDPADGTRLG
jgi:multiple sugar transport system ATP-binding protein